MEKKIVVGSGIGMKSLRLAALAATLPKNIQVVTLDQVQKQLNDEKELEDAAIRGINKMNQKNIELEFNSLRNIFIPQGSYVAKGKHRNGNNSKRPKPRKNKRK